MVRNYNSELKDNSGRKYAYTFDLDVLHHYMFKSMMPFFKAGNALELGCFEGLFTNKLLTVFDDITCIEASSEAIDKAQLFLSNLPDEKKIHFINSTFEESDLEKKFDNIILTHVLEHIDDPIALLEKIKDKWMHKNSRLLIVCPNANAPSRQIAVRMGLIEHNSAVTEAERKHGHRITYTLDTLEGDVRKSGLKSTYRSGIFFKALANFQWDKLLNTDIISTEYLEGCYELGHLYPDLCASIFVICDKDE